MTSNDVGRRILLTTTAYFVADAEDVGGDDADELDGMRFPLPARRPAGRRDELNSMTGHVTT